MLFKWVHRGTPAGIENSPDPVLMLISNISSSSRTSSSVLAPFPIDPIPPPAVYVDFESFAVVLLVDYILKDDLLNVRLARTRPKPIVK